MLTARRVCGGNSFSIGGGGGIDYSTKLCMCVCMYVVCISLSLYFSPVDINHQNPCPAKGEANFNQALWIQSNKLSPNNVKLCTHALCLGRRAVGYHLNTKLMNVLLGIEVKTSVQSNKSNQKSLPLGRKKSCPAASCTAETYAKSCNCSMVPFWTKRLGKVFLKGCVEVWW